VASSADLVCNIHQKALLFPHFGQSIAVVGSVSGPFSESMTLRELPTFLSAYNKLELVTKPASLFPLSFVAEKPHLGQVKIFSSIFDFMRVSHLGQNFIKNSSVYFFNAGFIRPDISLIISDALVLAS
jgi:hypothetical protein